jgi:hypothetical protein
VAIATTQGSTEAPLQAPGRLTHRDHRRPGLRFGLQFTAVRHGPPGYTRRASPAARTPMNLSGPRTLKLLIRWSMRTRRRALRFLA